jgi:nucleotide-binding universal stress UspA family protein
MNHWAAATIVGMANGIHRGTVVLAYDGSEHARAAIRDAADQLGPGRYAIVLTVWHDYEHVPAHEIPAEAAPAFVNDFAERKARKLAAEGAELARSVGFDAMPFAESGHPVWRRLIEVADAVNASLIVLGSHGRTGLSDAVLGSVAAATARHTDRDVLIVHAHQSIAGSDRTSLRSAVDSGA